MFELLDAVEGAGYLLGFWAFVFSPTYRAQVLARWRAAKPSTRIRLALNGIIATAIGVALPAVVLWIVLT